MRPSLVLLLSIAAAACGDDPTTPAHDAGVVVDMRVEADSSIPLDLARDMSDSSTPLDLATDDAGPPTNPLTGMGVVTLVDDGYGFLEGPEWREALGVLVFTDIEGDAIYTLTPPSTVTPFRSPASSPNGLAEDAAGNLLVCEQDAQRITRTLSSGTIETVVDDYMGMSFSSPNDLVVRSDGIVYFTDPPYGIGTHTREIDFNGVFRVDTDGSVTAEWEGELARRPNGIALSPDEHTLYFDDTSTGIVHAMTVASDGDLSDVRVFATTEGGADGMAVDTDGNVYVTSTAGIEVFAPDGSEWGTIEVPRHPANCAFGGSARSTLYITARDSLFRVELLATGL